MRFRFHELSRGCSRTRPRAWSCGRERNGWPTPLAAGDYRFQGLLHGLYSLKAGGKKWAVTVNGDAAMDLAGMAAPKGD